MSRQERVNTRVSKQMPMEGGMCFVVGLAGHGSKFPWDLILSALVTNVSCSQNKALRNSSSVVVHKLADLLTNLPR